MSFSNLIMDHIAPLLVHENIPILILSGSKSSNFDHNFMKLGQNVKYQMSFSSLIIVYVALSQQE